MAGRHKKHYDKSVYRSFTLIMQFGINMLVPICLMSAFGIWLDEKLGTSYWMVILFFVGAIAGGQNVFRMAKQIYADTGEKNTGKEPPLRKRNSTGQAALDAKCDSAERMRENATDSQSDRK